MKIVSKIFSALAVMAVLVAPFFTALPSKASTPFMGENGKIAFTKTVDGKPYIWSMDALGDHKNKLTNTSAYNPVWSPDGEQIVFVNDKTHKIQIMNADGSNRRNATKARGHESEPVWSMDGSRLAFVRAIEYAPGKSRSAIFTVKIANKKEKNVSGWALNLGYRSPSWSPDGKRLVYEHYNQNQSKLIINNLLAEYQRVLTVLSDVTDSANTSWSANGKKILYTDSWNEVYTIWQDGTHRAVISDGDSYSASWSPNGERIAFLEDFDTDGISISEEDGSVRLIPLDNDYDTISGPSWSPDGTKLVFTMSRFDNDELISDTFTIDVDSENPAPEKISSGYEFEFNWQVFPGFSIQ